MWDPMQLAHLMEDPMFWIHLFGLATTSLFIKLGQLLILAAEADPDIRQYVDDIMIRTLTCRPQRCSTLLDGTDNPSQIPRIAVLSTSPGFLDPRAEQAVRRAVTNTTQAIADAEADGAHDTMEALRRALNQLTSLSSIALDNHLFLEDVHAATDAELAAADALSLLEDAVDQAHQAGSATDVIKLARQGAQDYFVLVCTRALTAPDDLRERGIPRSLRLRMNAAYGSDIAQNSDLWSRLGNSKHQLFARGMRFSRRPNKKKPRSLSARAPAQPGYTPIFSSRGASSVD